VFRGVSSRYQVVLHERVVEAERERTTLRLRLSGVALGATLLLLGSTVDRQPAVMALLAYLAVAVVQRYFAPRFPGSRVAAAGIVLDVVFAAAFVSALPLATPAWALFALAIGIAAHRFGAWGAVAATAGAIATYDIVLGARSVDLRASDLWPVQVLLAIGLICTELVFVTARSVRDRSELRAFILAQRDVATARTAEDLLSRLVTHTALALGADGAWVQVSERGTFTIHHQRGLGESATGHQVEAPIDERTTLVARLGEPNERTESFIRDIADVARATMASLDEQHAQGRTIALLSRVAESLRSFAPETEPSGVLAHVVMSAEALGGVATVVRRSDGAIVAGAPLDPDLVATVRETRPPDLSRNIVASQDGTPRDIAIASVGSGLALVLVSAAALTTDHLRALDTLGQVGGGLLARISERDALFHERRDLRGMADRLQGELQQREDTIASTVHELRTPLTSVTAYGQLISKNLQSALAQLAQLDRIIGDLRRDPASGLSLTEIDLHKCARDAAQRQRLLSEASVSIEAEGDGPFTAIADGGRLGQVLDNLLGNAVKFSSKGDEIEVVVRRAGDRIVLSVTDSGVGLAPDQLERVFQRYYRAGEGDVPGLGIGLAVSHEIIAAQGGRIWAESAGAGRGATFNIELPASSSVASTL
jgi:signal transduction histidine kinase